MTDFDYEVRDRKQLARASRYVKRGSKSKKCTLPHDGLTRGQLKKMNGGVFVFNLNRPMSWREFRTMSEVSQREYIEGLQSKFNANAPALAQMFGVTGNCVRLYLKEVFGIVGTRGKSMTDSEKDAWLDFITAPESPVRGLESKSDPDIVTVICKTPTEEDISPDVNRNSTIRSFLIEYSDNDLNAFEITCNGIRISSADWYKTFAELDPDAERFTVCIQTKPTVTHIDNFIVEFSGMISPESIYNTLRSMLKGRADGTVTIECKFA